MKKKQIIFTLMRVGYSPTLTHNGNQLVKVSDTGTDGLYYGDEEFVKNTANPGNSCAYDANGNRLYDSNSNVWAIKYNVLNLPDAMQFQQRHQTLYTYSANGTKLKVVDKTAPPSTLLPVSGLDASAARLAQRIVWANHAVEHIMKCRRVVAQDPCAEKR